MFGGPEEAFLKELCRSFAFGLHMIGRLCVGRYRRVVHLDWSVEAVEGSFAVGYLAACLCGDETLGIPPPPRS